MTKDEINAICKERLGNWRADLVEYHATPVLLVGVGHDQRSGQVTLCVTEEMSRENMILFFEAAVEMLKKNINISEHKVRRLS